MYLLMAGRSLEADSILAGTPPYPREDALDAITKVMMETTVTGAPERHAFRAFGINPLDVDANRYVLRRLHREGYLQSAAAVARDLLVMVPGDSESLAIVAEAEARPESDRVTSPVEAGGPGDERPR